MNLTEQKCVPCEGGMAPLSQEQARLLLQHISQWSISDDGNKISKHLTFKDFKEALGFINNVGSIAESQQHHPDIHLTGYKNVSIDLSTHAIDGLSQNDFIVAAKIDQL